ncbi:MBOAT family O-acyltransferase [Calditrichota bacterium]
MLFNSYGYLLFLLAAIILHWALPHRFRIYLLCVLSIAFYAMWRWEFALVMIFSAFVDFSASKMIIKSESRGGRRGWLLVSLVVNLGLLIFFKYSYFIHDNVAFITHLIGIELPEMTLKIILPLGISFYTFQTISYTIDVFRKVIEPTNDFIVFLTYVTFWPQLIAGPVLRAKEVLPQLIARREVTYADITAGIERILFGLFKKVVLADNIARFVDVAFSLDPNVLSAFDVWVGTILFGFQIYFDFSGYSDVAIGSARLLGIRFPENFNWPYMALDPRDFWKRWHISLSAWIRDYLYLPLTKQEFKTNSTGGIAVATESTGRQKDIALFTTWFIMGLWHGAGWTFAVWGVYHALLIFVYRRSSGLQKLSQKIPVVAWGIMFLLSMAGWIPFRANSLDQTLSMFQIILNPSQYNILNRSLVGYAYISTAMLMVGMLGTYLVRHYYSKTDRFKSRMVVGKVFVVSTLVVLIFIYLQPVRQFIYFQF